MGQRAEHPADRVAQLAIGLDEGLQDLRADAQIVRIVGRRHPQAQDVGAGFLDHVLRRDHVADRTSTSSGPSRRGRSRGSARCRRARGRACRSSPAGRSGTSRDAGRSLRDTSPDRDRHRPCGSPSGRRASPARRRGCSRNRTTRRGCRRSCRNRSTSWPPAARKRAPSSLYQASAPSFSKASAMASFTRSSLRISLVPLRTKTAIGTPQARWRETTQSGRFSIMPVMRFSPDCGTHSTVLIA